jgi:hypothetical protein
LDSDGQKSDILIEEQTKIAYCAEEGIKTANIATRLGCHPATVFKHIALFKKMQKNRRQRQGKAMFPRP